MAASQQLLQLAAQSPVLAQTRITGLGAGAQLSLTIDRDKAAALGVDFAEAAQLVSTAMGSAYVGKLTNQGWHKHAWVQADQGNRMQPDEVLKLTARNSHRDMVPTSPFLSYEER